MHADDLPSLETLNKVKSSPLTLGIVSKGLIYSVRPSLAHLYVQAKAPHALSITAKGRDPLTTEDGKPSGLSLLALAVHFYSFSDSQLMMAKSYAAAFFLGLDSMFQQLRKPLRLSFKIDFGRQYAGYHLSRVVHATTNQIRHGYNWINEAPQDDGIVLRAIGVEKLTDDSVPLSVLSIIGREDYFSLEDDLCDAVIEMWNTIPADSLTAISLDSD